MTEPIPGPVFTLNNYGSGAVAQGVNVTQNVGSAPADLVGLVVQLRGLAVHMGSRHDQFTADVDLLENSQTPAPDRASAWQRIKDALTQTIGQVGASGILLAGEQVVAAIN
ncbi:hypothetical protein ACFYUY_31175 [Kitasatospora sp. NPDC004745]|uniref:hypothetical protein n=1 Tax=Kitasatospora sp. NPDC004745 TaxID=3364019 RepID=UPI0036B10E53